MPLTADTFAGRVAIVTGSSRGIGAGIATYFAAHGCSLSLHGRDEAALNSVRDQCVAAGLKAEQINNAAMWGRDTVETLTSEQFDETMRVNLKSAVFLTELCVPHLEKTRGNVVNISSLDGKVAPPEGFAYGMSKAALNSATKGSALQLSRKGIRVNAVNPAFVRTAIFQSVIGDETIVNQLFDVAKQGHPIGRIGEPEDIAKAVAFLASNDDSSWITGVCLAVDGGALLDMHLNHIFAGNSGT